MEALLYLTCCHSESWHLMMAFFFITQTYLALQIFSAVAELILIRCSGTEKFPILGWIKIKVILRVLVFWKRHLELPHLNVTHATIRVTPNKYTATHLASSLITTNHLLQVFYAICIRSMEQSTEKPSCT